jgi:hypothetical protein
VRIVGASPIAELRAERGPEEDLAGVERCCRIALPASVNNGTIKSRRGRDDMTIQQLRQAAKDLRETANRVLLYSEKNSLEDVWQKLEQLFRQVPQVLGKRAGGFTLEGVSKSWDEVSKRADHIMQACETAEPPAGEEIPGDFGEVS